MENKAKILGRKVGFITSHLIIIVGIIASISLIYEGEYTTIPMINIILCCFYYGSIFGKNHVGADIRTAKGVYEFADKYIDVLDEIPSPKEMAKYEYCQYEPNFDNGEISKWFCIKK